MTTSILAPPECGRHRRTWGFYHSLGGQPLWKVEMEFSVDLISADSPLAFKETTEVASFAAW